MSLYATFGFVPPALWILALMAASCGLLLRRRRLVQGTTLAGPWRWTLGSLGVIGGTHLVISITNRGTVGDRTNWETALLFAAAASSFCPLMSLLGAKRPQDRGWPVVVVSLWAILILPVAESLVLRDGQMPDVQGARSWFMLILIGLGIANFLATRFWFPAILFGGGQVLMLADSLPVIRELVDTSPTIAGFSCCAVACIVALQLARRGSHAVGSLNIVWRDYRDAFGLLWGLRVAEQVNIAARTSDWPLTLRWQGFVDERGETLDWNSLSDETRQALHQIIQNLLRRFVSSEWIAVRMGNALE
jgi:hypothetical protein